MLAAERRARAFRGPQGDDSEQTHPGSHAPDGKLLLPAMHGMTNGMMPCHYHRCIMMMLKVNDEMAMFIS